MGAFTNILLGKASSDEKIPDKVEALEIKEAFDAHREETLKAVNGALDKRLARFEPFLAKAEEDEKKRKEEEEDAKALAAINQRRKARGLAPIVAEEDDDDEDMDKKAPGKHGPGRSKSKSKSEEDEDKKENPFEKKDDKDARFEQLQSQLTELAGIVKAVTQGKTAESTALDVDASGTENRLTLKSNGKTVPFEKTWQFALETAPSLKSAMYANGFDQNAVDEFDIAVSNLRFDLKKEGIQPPKPTTKNGIFA